MSAVHLLKVCSSSKGSISKLSDFKTQNKEAAYEAER